MYVGFFLRTIVFSIPAYFFAWVAWILALWLALDLLATSVYFLIYGEFLSVLQKGMEFVLDKSGENGIFRPETWQLATGLKGLDQLVSEFMILQFDPQGRIKMLLISLAFAIPLNLITVVAGGNNFLKEMMQREEQSGERNEPGLIYFFTAIAAIALTFPVMALAPFGCIFQLAQYFGYLS